MGSVQSEGAGVGESANDSALELYKMEYERLFDRYENLYQALWRIFSYLTVVSAGIFTFGSKTFDRDELALLASVPLVFWYLSTYIPLDRYGKCTEKTIQELEALVNKKYGVQLSHFSSFSKRRVPRKEVGHLLKGREWKKVGRYLVGQLRRTCFWVHVTFAPLIVWVVYRLFFSS